MHTLRIVGAQLDQLPAEAAMTAAILFGLGLLIGATVGVVAMALMIMARDNGGDPDA